MVGMCMACYCGSACVDVIYSLVTGGGEDGSGDARACDADICVAVPELFHESHTVVEHCDVEYVEGASSCCGIQDCRYGSHQVLLGA